MTTVNFRAFGVRLSAFANSNGLGVELAAKPPFGRLSKPSVQSKNSKLSTVAPTDSLATRIDAITWYHTIDLGDGLVTPGYYDHRPILDRYEFPDRLDGMRVLDVATFDGFWAFEFERRGAAEVVALDIPRANDLDLAPRVRSALSEAELNRSFDAGFQLAHAHLRSQVRHVHCNVYDMTPEALGYFDLVHCGDLLLHLRDPVLALTRIRSVTKGSAFISDCIFPDLDRHDSVTAQYEGGVNDNIWWRFGAKALSSMISDAGFDQVRETARFRYGPRAAPPTMWHVVYCAA